ncbi:MAG: hypothetical protein NTY48_04380 [Candidatus Diapherotrites archaeon]|nr:hypothetical protein [Candidatus Diapherotrites archaeon]
MKLKEITVTVSQKVGTANYGSKGFGLSATAELAENDDLLRVKQDLTNKLSQMLDFEIKRIKVEGGKK